MHAAKNYVAMCNRLHRRACETEGIDPDAAITTFSDDNPYGQKFRAVFNQEKYDRSRRLAKR